MARRHKTADKKKQQLMTVAQQKNKQKDRLNCVSCLCLGCFILPIPGIEPVTSELQMSCLTIRVRAISDVYLLSDGIHTLVLYFSHKNPNQIFSVLQHAVACCGMLQNPHQQAPKTGAAACFNRCCLPVGAIGSTPAHFVLHQMPALFNDPFLNVIVPVMHV